MRFRVLGQLEAYDGERSYHLGAPMQRVLLAHLLLTVGRTLPVGELVDRLWDGAAPARAVSTLHVHVLRLRRVLAATGCVARIETGARAYRLDLGTDTLDAVDFQRAVVGVMEAGDVAAELTAINAALGLWVGDVLEGVPGDWPRYREVRMLTELRTAVREQRAKAYLAAGRFVAAVEELRALVTEYPDREQLRHLLVLALHRTGRRAEALAAYDDAYRFAVDHLGLVPGEELQRLQQKILHGSPEGHSAVLVHRPCLLPARRGRLVGRDGRLAELGAALRGGATTCVITGMPGVGKSSLAVWLAHAVRDEFPDGQLYADLDGGRADTSVVLARFLRLLGVRHELVPDGLAARAELFRVHTTDRRILVVLDDVADAARIRALLPGDGRSAVIVTSRNSLAALDGAVRCRLDELTPRDSIVLLGQFAGAPRITREPAAARSIVERCGRLPLALRIAGSLLAARPDQSVAALAALLDDDRRALDLLVCEDLSVWAGLARSYEALPVNARRAFRLVGFVDADRGFTLSTVTALLNSTEEEGRAVVATLIDAHLITAAGDIYRMSRLTSLFARSQAERRDARRAG
jgi:DNA-binding SARP family transcriptional activator